jgi:hypothetical protein
MGQIKDYSPVKLIIAVTISDINLWAKVLEKLEILFTSTDHNTDWYNFNHTDYYREEMGRNLKKRMISFEKLIKAENLPVIKITANNLEQEFSEDNKRRINLDPGYITPEKLILATTKDYSHRIYLNKGIFGDLHLTWQKHHFQPNSWTYPDYREHFILQFFEMVRENYLAQLGDFK